MIVSGCGWVSDFHPESLARDQRGHLQVLCQLSRLLMCGTARGNDSSRPAHTGPLPPSSSAYCSLASRPPTSASSRFPAALRRTQAMRPHTRTLTRPSMDCRTHTGAHGQVVVRILSCRSSRGADQRDAYLGSDRCAARGKLVGDGLFLWFGSGTALALSAGKLALRAIECCPSRASAGYGDTHSRRACVC